MAKTPCRVAVSPLRVRVSPTKFLLPDVMVVCGKPDFFVPQRRGSTVSDVTVNSSEEAGVSTSVAESATATRSSSKTVADRLLATGG